MYLDFNKEEKGYKRFYLDRSEIRKNIGKQICFVLKRDVCNHRGYYNVSYGILMEIKYSQLRIDEHDTFIDIRDVLECGIKIE